MLVFYICLEQVKITGREVFISVHVTKSFTTSTEMDVWSLIRPWGFPYNENLFCGGGGARKTRRRPFFGRIETSETQSED